MSMSIGAGIAMAAIWAFPMACVLHPRMTGVSVFVSCCVSLGATLIIAVH